MTGKSLTTPSVFPFTEITMSNTFIDKACAVVPKFENRISIFHKKLCIAQYAEQSIYDYKLKIAQAALHLQKLPDDFTQDDIEGYLSSLLDQKRYSISYFKHTVFGLQNYYKVMGLKEPKGLVLPKVRKLQKLPRVLSQRSIARLVQCCNLYNKTLLALIYDCALRVSEACRLRWEDVCFDRRMLFVCQSKGNKDRYVPISSQMLIVLSAFRKRYPSDDFVFKTHGKNVTPQRINPGYVRTILKNALTKAALDPTITIHALRHSAATHLLENGESILDVMNRLGHKRISTTMNYLHVADIERIKHVRLIDTLFPPRQ